MSPSASKERKCVVTHPAVRTLVRKKFLGPSAENNMTLIESIKTLPATSSGASRRTQAQGPAPSECPQRTTLPFRQSSSSSLSDPVAVSDHPNPCRVIIRRAAATVSLRVTMVEGELRRMVTYGNSGTMKARPVLRCIYNIAAAGPYVPLEKRVDKIF